ncbi:hypothetical protein ICE98_02779 [Lactococcus lactis]|nr:hypothetical protein [Lactococcus lactis]
MGLFDRLFGKKKQEDTNHDVPVSEKKKLLRTLQEPKNEEEIEKLQNLLK